MKRTMLWAALFTLIGTQVHAEPPQPVTQPQTPGSAAMPATTQTTPGAAQPTQGTPQVQPQSQSQPAPTTAAQPQPAPVINCDYKIPATTKHIDQSLVLTWSEKAVVQVFEFEPVSIDTQMQKLKACFTDQGWTGFGAALDKSGNLKAIKEQKLTVSSQIDGQSQVTEAKDNQWKITLPLQVVYQNDKEKVTQLLNVNITVSRKISGDLGIAQLVATPRIANPTPESGNAASNPEHPANATPGTSQPSPTEAPSTPH